MIRLESDPVARNKAIAACDIHLGTCVLQEATLASVLLPAEKGRRCDACFRSNGSLKRCSGCASYWYCNAECQNLHWILVHRQMCKKFARFMASSAIQVLSEHEKMDAILLSHLVVQIADLSDTQSGPASVFLSLLPGPTTNSHIPPICTTPSSITKDTLDTIGHGIFPNASRFFNHSCMPNAAAKYQFTQAQQVTMEVMALRDIAAGEEVFEDFWILLCSRAGSRYLRSAMALPPSTDEVITRLGKALQLYVGLNDVVGPNLPYMTFDSLPKRLLPVLQESYITSLSEIFSRTSHEANYEQANETGLMLLALYLLVYPKNYPQIGAHLLEMAKTHWNALVTSQINQDMEHAAKEKIRNLLQHARDVFNVMGHEGDGKGWLDEADILQDLLNE